jgi:hypothetical protein
VYFLPFSTPCRRQWKHWPSHCWLPCNATILEWWAYPRNYCGHGYLVTTASSQTRHNIKTWLVEDKKRPASVHTVTDIETGSETTPRRVLVYEHELQTRTSLIKRSCWYMWNRKFRLSFQDEILHVKIHVSDCEIFQFCSSSSETFVMVISPNTNNQHIFILRTSYMRQTAKNLMSLESFNAGSLQWRCTGVRAHKFI